MDDVTAPVASAAPAPPAVAPAAAPAPGAAPAAAGDGGAPKAPASTLLGDAPAAKPGEAAPAATAAPTAVEQRAYLTEKAADDAAKKALEGKTDEEVAKLYETQKAKDDKAAAESAIEFKLPEGFTMDEAQAAAFRETLADAKLTPSERGQKLVDLHVAAMKQAVEAPQKLWYETQAKWANEVKADPELGGDAFDTNKAKVAKVIDELGGKEAGAMREAFNFTGAGNHPQMFRLLLRVANVMTEGGPTHGAAPGTSELAKTDASLMSMYPSAAKAR